MDFQGQAQGKAAWNAAGGGPLVLGKKLPHAGGLPARVRIFGTLADFIGRPDGNICKGSSTRLNRQRLAVCRSADVCSISENRLSVFYSSFKKRWD